MRRCHFDLIDTNNVTDANGAILDNDNHARKAAPGLAREARERSSAARSPPGPYGLSPGTGLRPHPRNR
jgi:hypothetical protein